MRIKEGKIHKDHIFALKQIMAKYYEFEKDLHLILVNYKQTYDSVDSKSVWTQKNNSMKNSMQIALFARHFRFL